MFPEGTGSFVVLLAIAEQEKLFEKHGVEVDQIAARGATVPRLSDDAPIGLIGEPAVILQSADGTDLRIVASFSSAPLSGHLVARADIRTPEDLRGKRVGVRVVGAGVWISTIIALEQLGLSPEKDGIATVPIGSPAEILQALERGVIDAALVSAAQGRHLQARGYTGLLTEYPPDLTTFGGCLATKADYLRLHSDVVQNICAALIEAMAFGLAEVNTSAVMRAFDASLGVTDEDVALSNLRELRPIPYPSRDALVKIQGIIATHDPRAAAVHIDRLVDERPVRALDEAGFIAGVYDTYRPQRRLSTGGR
jgi:ABC-type nitrate/sulfonate/bicarbonate transport system substrate-binding protein